MKVNSPSYLSAYSLFRFRLVDIEGIYGYSYLLQGQCSGSDDFIEMSKLKVILEVLNMN